MWDWTLLSKESMDEIIGKAGRSEWESMDDEAKEQWLNENLTEEEGDRYETESRRALLNQNAGKRRGKKRVTRKRKMTRRRRQTRRKVRVSGRKRR